MAAGGLSEHQIRQSSAHLSVGSHYVVTDISKYITMKCLFSRADATIGNQMTLAEVRVGNVDAAASVAGTGKKR